MNLRTENSSRGPIRAAAVALAFGAAALRAVGAPPADAASQTANEMVLVLGGERVVGTSPEERIALARRFGCDPTWLNDDQEKHAVKLPPFWIDRHPVTNAQYAAFIAATGARAPWANGAYVTGTADQPVADVTFFEAAAYAAWAGKRLPTAEEWEVAAQARNPDLFPWGDDWPGLVRPHPPDAIPDWRRPWTDPVGTGRHGRSAAGMEDFIQQVCEWTNTTMPHHGTTFAVVKGTSWLNEDAINFRSAASSWALGLFSTPWIGFRCALDGGQTEFSRPKGGGPRIGPAEQVMPGAASGENGGGVRICRLGDVPPDIGVRLLDWTRTFLGRDRHVPIPQSRGFLLYTRECGPWPVGLFLSEALSWNKTDKMHGSQDTDPILHEEPAAAGRSAYSLHFPEIDVTYEFVPGDDHVDLVTTVVNRTDRDGEFSTTSCYSLTNHPFFYDCEMVRTYVFTRDAGFVPLRQIPRPGDCIRWIQPSDTSRYGGCGTPVAMAVVSSDGRWVFASVRYEPGDAGEARGNTWLNCLHTEAPITVGAQKARTTRQRLYFFRGDLKQFQAVLLRDPAPL